MILGIHTMLSNIMICFIFNDGQKEEAASDDSFKSF